MSILGLDQSSMPFEDDTDGIAAAAAAATAAAAAATASAAGTQTADPSPALTPAQLDMAGEALANTPATAEVATVHVRASGLIDANRVMGTTVVAMREAAAVLNSFRGALPVEYNTLDQIIASNGNFMDRESDKMLGDSVEFTYVSFQDAYVVSPEVEKADKKLLRYSDDGITCSDSTPVKDHINFLKASGYPDARLKQRVVVVGAIESATKTKDFDGLLVQFDLSPVSRLQWERFNKQMAYQLGTGRRKEIGRVRAEVQTKTGNDNVKFPVVTFRAV